MGIFNKGDNERLPVSSSKTTIISEGSQIRGELRFSGSVHIDGYVEGNISCEGIVTVGKSGKVKGVITADKIIVKGFVDGNADCNIVEILEGGKFVGEIHYNQILIEPKGVFEGSLKVKGGKIKKIEEKKEEIVQKHEAVQ
ncbi:MAG TPA: cell shape determination protein CcmA [Persephonella sp.]|uniref:bactofilin family protein n=1 Tax=Persephonella TaxID=182899 RepID=UPI0005A01F98|nr:MULTISPECIES: polymer-forming cytoskeletal protein [Persephonella]HCB70632.1 cell shape determination protein CcmA [Persephonella sp.]